LQPVVTSDKTDKLVVDTRKRFNVANYQQLNWLSSSYQREVVRGNDSGL
jgi:hypothetical protein